MRQDDADLRLQVEAALAALMPSNISVSAKSGRIHLRGVVMSATDARRAEQLTRSVPEVVDVRVDLAIMPIGSIGTAADVGGPAADLMATGFEGQVRLADTTIDLNDRIGTTDPQVATEEAIPYTPPTDPVVLPRLDGDPRDIEVIAGFGMSASPSADTATETVSDREMGDDEIARSVRRALRADAGTADLAVEIRVREGFVTLRGEVTSLDDAEHAEAIASDVPGVVGVTEELEVQALR